MSCFGSFTEIPDFHRFSKQCFVLNQIAQGMSFFALAREGMRQSDIAARVGVARKNR